MPKKLFYLPDKCKFTKKIVLWQTQKMIYLRKGIFSRIDENEDYYKFANKNFDFAGFDH